MSQTASISSKPTSTKKVPPTSHFFGPLRSIRLNCLDCAGSPKSVLWCTCDGIHSTRCHIWQYRFGMRPKTVVQKYGPALVTPKLMPGEDVCEDDLPNGMEAATSFLERVEGYNHHRPIDSST